MSEQQQPTEMTRRDPVSSTALPAGEKYAPARVIAFRQAFAVIGVLVAEGVIQVDFNDAGWFQEFEVMIDDVAQALAITASD
jgi:hypothetical protein